MLVFEIVKQVIFQKLGVVILACYTVPLFFVESAKIGSFMTGLR